MANDVSVQLGNVTYWKTHIKNVDISNDIATSYSSFDCGFVSQRGSITFVDYNDEIYSDSKNLTKPPRVKINFDKASKGLSNNLYTIKDSARDVLSKTIRLSVEQIRTDKDWLSLPFPGMPFQKEIRTPEIADYIFSKTIKNYEPTFPANYFVCHSDTLNLPNPGEPRDRYTITQKDGFYSTSSVNQYDRAFFGFKIQPGIPNPLSISVEVKNPNSSKLRNCYAGLLIDKPSNQGGGIVETIAITQTDGYSGTINFTKHDTNADNEYIIVEMDGNSYGLAVKMNLVDTPIGNELVRPFYNCEKTLHNVYLTSSTVAEALQKILQVTQTNAQIQQTSSKYKLFSNNDYDNGQAHINSVIPQVACFSTQEMSLLPEYVYDSVDMKYSDNVLESITISEVSPSSYFNKKKGYNYISCFAINIDTDRTFYDNIGLKITTLDGSVTSGTIDDKIKRYSYVYDGMMSKKEFATLIANRTIGDTSVNNCWYSIDPISDTNFNVYIAIITKRDEKYNGDFSITSFGFDITLDVYKEVQKSTIIKENPATIQSNELFSGVGVAQDIANDIIYKYANGVTIVRKKLFGDGVKGGDIVTFDGDTDSNGINKVYKVMNAEFYYDGQITEDITAKSLLFWHTISSINKEIPSIGTSFVYDIYLADFGVKWLDVYRDIEIKFTAGFVDNGAVTTLNLGATKLNYGGYATGSTQQVSTTIIASSNCIRLIFSGVSASKVSTELKKFTLKSLKIYC